MKTVRDFDFSDKKVIVRLDLNVPLDNGKILDDYRITTVIPTLKHILGKCKKMIILSHAGRPKGERVESLSLKPVAQRLSELLGQEVAFGDLEDVPESRIVLLENLRFYPEEKKNDEKFAKKLASLADIYVNDAFAVSHRKHASVVGIPKHIHGCIGFQLEKELKNLRIENAEKPVVAIMGGAKLETKVPVIENLLEKVDYILIGGAMMFTFYKAKGWEIGESLLDNEQLRKAKKLMQNKKIILPTDVIIAKSKDALDFEEVQADDMPEGMIGLDIGPDTLSNYMQILDNAKTIIWNGPLGYYENEIFAKATDELAGFLADLAAKTILGGGDTAAVANKLGLADKFTHVSTGGGAALQLLAGEKLPGLEALD
ncbi:phosphoglycerate kinase [Nanoarchaeota archaeon]